MSFVTTSYQVPEWAAHCPEGWQRDWLKWSVECRPQRPSEEQAAELPYISNEDIGSWTGKLLRDDPQPSESEGRVFQRDDVLFNKLRPYLAKVYHAEFDGISSGELLCLRSGARVVPSFLFYVLASKGFIDAVDSASFGTKMPRADWGIVGHQPLPLPPLETQRRIARFLDAKTARIDALIAKKRALLARLAEKRQALITQAVTKGLDPNVPMKDSGIDWLGQVPAHWDVKAIVYVATVGNGSTPRRDDVSYWDGGRYRWLNSSVVNLDQVTDASDWVTDVAMKECHLPWIEPPAVLVGITGEGRTRGMSSLLVVEATINQHLAYIKPIDGASDASYLRYVMSVAYAYLRNESDGGGSTKGAITCEQLAHMRVPVPSIAEQVAIASAVDQAASRVRVLEDRVQTSIDRFSEYRSALITAAVTGQLEIPADGQNDRPDECLGKLATEVA